MIWITSTFSKASAYDKTPVSIFKCKLCVSNGNDERFRPLQCEQ